MYILPTIEQQHGNTRTINIMHAYEHFIRGTQIKSQMCVSQLVNNVGTICKHRLPSKQNLCMKYNSTQYSQSIVSYLFHIRLFAVEFAYFVQKFQEEGRYRKTPFVCGV